MTSFPMTLNDPGIKVMIICNAEYLRIVHLWLVQLRINFIYVLIICPIAIA